MRSTATRPRDAARQSNVSLRVSEAVKERIERAAAYAGLSVSRYIETTMDSRSQEIIREHEVIALSDEATRILVEAYLSPQIPDGLGDSFAAHERLIRRSAP